MLKLDLILQIMNWVGCYQKEKIKIRLMKDKLGWKIMTKKVELKAKSYSYLIDDGSEDKVAKVRKKRVTKIILKFENYKSILEATQLDSKISFLKK